MVTYLFWASFFFFFFFFCLLISQLGCLVGCFVLCQSTLSRTFNAELNFKQFSFFVYKQLNVKTVQLNVKNSSISNNSV